MILVTFNDNYADEFDTQGFRIMTQPELDQYLASAREDFIRESATEQTPERYHYGHTEPELVFDDKEVESGFGTNESWMWHSYEDFMSSISCAQITQHEAYILVRHCGADFGMFPYMGEW